MRKPVIGGFLKELAFKLALRNEILTCIAIHPSGEHILTGSLDNLIRW